MGQFHTNGSLSEIETIEFQRHKILSLTTAYLLSKFLAQKTKCQKFESCLSNFESVPKKF